MVVREEKNGAKKTHTLRTSMVMCSQFKMWYIDAEVTINPGYMVPERIQAMINEHLSTQQTSKCISFFCRSKKMVGGSKNLHKHKGVECNKKILQESLRLTRNSKYYTDNIFIQFIVSVHDI